MMVKLNGKDLINVGVYSGIYFVIVFLVSMLGLIPVLYPMLVVFVPILGGIPFMLFLSKVKKFGMIWIMSIVMGIMMILVGMGYYPLIVGVVTGLIAELVYKSGGYHNAAKAVLTCGIFNVWVWGNYLLLFINRSAYFATRQDLGQEYIVNLSNMMPIWMCPALLAACIICGLMGGLLGKSLLKKHFTKAGIA